MRVHRHILRASTMLDKVEELVQESGGHPDDLDNIVEHIQTIRSDIKHVDRKLAAFDRIVFDVLRNEGDQS